jgi:hypothetical protein
MSEIFVNDPSTTLNGAITSATTTLVVNAGGGFPTSGNFRIRIEDELLLVTAVTGTTWTVTRGVEGTVAVTHGNTTPVNAYLTAGALTQFSSETNGVGLWSALPTIPPQTNSFYEASDSIYDAISTGTGSWNYYGPAYRLYPPSFQTWSWVNQGTATVTNAGGSIQIQDVAGSNTPRLYMKSVPTPPYKIHMRFNFLSNGNDSGTFGGFYWRESSTGKFVMAVMRANGVPSVYSSTSTTTPAYTQIFDPSAFFPNSLSTGCWNYVYADDGTNKSYGMTVDGSTILNMTTWARNTGFTSAADQVGFGINSSTNAGAIFVMSWREY